jgi:pimeloyl-ACP methyl ester carboxylesterase
MEPTMEKNFEIKGKQLACTIEGDTNNPPIIFIHGCPSHRGVWRKTIDILRINYYCIAVDLLGFGASDKPEGGDYSLTAQGQRILQIADKLGLQKFSIIGHSMGGQLALYVAAVLAPNRIQKIVTVNGLVTGRFTDQFEKGYIRTVSLSRRLPVIFNLIRSLLIFKPIVKNTFKQWFFDFSSYPYCEWKPDRDAATNPTCVIPFDESFKAIRSLDLTQHLRKIKAETLIISGKKDEIVPIDQALLAQTLIPNNNLALIEKCGHFPMYERNVNFMKALGIIF